MDRTGQEWFSQEWDRNFLITLIFQMSKQSQFINSCRLIKGKMTAIIYKLTGFHCNEKLYTLINVQILNKCGLFAPDVEKISHATKWQHCLARGNSLTIEGAFGISVQRHIKRIVHSPIADFILSSVLRKHRLDSDPSLFQKNEVSLSHDGAKSSDFIG